MKPLRSLQVLRGVAAWLVAYHHYTEGFHDFEPTALVVRFFAHRGKFGVDLFFVLSGFVMYYTLHGHRYAAKEFLLRRLIRIVPAYWFMTFAAIPVAYAFPTALSKLTDWTAYNLGLSLLFIPHANPGAGGTYPLLTVGWTLNFEMFFYVWLSLMLAVFRRNWFPICVGSMLALPFVWPSSWPCAVILGSPMLFEFVLGMLVSWLYLNGDRLGRSHGIALGSVLLAGGVLVLFWKYDSIYALSAAGMLIGAALALDPHVSRIPKIGFWQHLGDISYSTYLVHVLSLTVCVFVLGKPASLVEGLVDIGIYTFLTLALSELSYRWVETGPASEKLKKWLLPSNVQAVTPIT